MEKISIRDAVRTFGKSDSYFRRIQREWKVSKPKAVFMYEGKVHFDLNELNKKFNQIGVKQKGNIDQGQNERALNILERELQEKNKQIEALTERLKESNLLTAQLQQSIKLIEQNQQPKKRRWFW